MTKATAITMAAMLAWGTSEASARLREPGDLVTVQVWYDFETSADIDERVVALAKT
jgi:hypothetical protein